MDQLADGNHRARIGLALAGGGPQGAVYEIGALSALEEVLEGVEFHRDVHAYVGVSAGAFLSAFLANGMTVEQIRRSLVRDDENPLTRSVMFRPAFGEYAKRGAMLPRLAWEALREYASAPLDQNPFDAASRLVRALPVGLFDNDPLRRFIERLLDRPGRSDDFRQLRRALFVVAADLDSGEAVRFGEPGWDDIPISKAVQASTALPGLFPPVEIRGRHYLDGVLLKTLHASTALEAGAELLICINPIVPVDTEDTVRAGVMRRGKLAYRGFPTVMAQTFRTLIHSRMTSVLEAYEEVYPGKGLLLLEPRRDDYRMFFTNIFSIADRKKLCDHAYRSTRAQLWERREELTELFDGYGIRFHADRLDDPARSLWTDEAPPAELTERLDSTLDRLEALLSAR